MGRPEAVNGDFVQKVAAARREMSGWPTKSPTEKELRSYGFDLLLRARVILGHRSSVYWVPIPSVPNVPKDDKLSLCRVRVSAPHVTLDTRTSGSVRTLSIVEKLPDGSDYPLSDYPLPDHTIEIVESFTPNLHTGESDEQVDNVVSAINNGTDPTKILKEGKVAFTIYPNGQLEDWHGLRNFPQSMTLCSLTLLEMEQPVKQKPKLVLARS